MRETPGRSVGETVERNEAECIEWNELLLSKYLIERIIFPPLTGAAARGDNRPQRHCSSSNYDPFDEFCHADRFPFRPTSARLFFRLLRLSVSLPRFRAFSELWLVLFARIHIALHHDCLILFLCPLPAVDRAPCNGIGNHHVRTYKKKSNYVSCDANR